MSLYHENQALRIKTSVRASELAGGSTHSFKAGEIGVVVGVWNDAVELEFLWPIDDPNRPMKCWLAMVENDKLEIVAETEF